MKLQWVMQRPAANIKLSAAGSNLLSAPDYLFEGHCIPVT